MTNGPQNPTTTDEPTLPQEGNSGENGPQLTLADIKNAVSVIDHAAEQGAFKGWQTIAQVMEVRQRLAAFAESASPSTPEEQGQQENQQPVQPPVAGEGQ